MDANRTVRASRTRGLRAAAGMTALLALGAGLAACSDDSEADHRPAMAQACKEQVRRQLQGRNLGEFGDISYGTDLSDGETVVVGGTVQEKIRIGTVKRRWTCRATWDDKSDKPELGEISIT